MGHANDLNEYPAGNGGGIIIISASSLLTNGHRIMANGLGATEAASPEECKDGLAGGGGGGSILLNVASPLDNLKMEAKGGKGADHITLLARHGAGGGGGGGFIAVSQAVIPSLYTADVSGGMSGVNVNHNADPYGAQPGGIGIFQNSFTPFTSLVPFVKNIDSVKIKETVSDCNQFRFEGIAFTQHTPAATWAWRFGDGGSAQTQDVNYTYTSSGNLNTKLTITDVNGCSDSVTVLSVLGTIAVKTDENVTSCVGTVIPLHASGADNYAWSPAASFSNPNSPNPQLTVTGSATYTVTGSNILGCRGSATITLTATPKPAKSGN